MNEGGDFWEVLGYIIMGLTTTLSVLFWVQNPYRNDWQDDAPRFVGLLCAVVIFVYIYAVHHELIRDVIHKLS